MIQEDKNNYLKIIEAILFAESDLVDEKAIKERRYSGYIGLTLGLLTLWQLWIIS